ncbi:MAG TPA: transcriptional initiation protein Tat, partial [Polyangia bacterium]|nr:transcriptional initiation protein Tat [Polyangia bacterium]
HSAKNVPIVLLGMVGAGIPAGGRVIDTGEQVFNRLGCTILNLMGDPRPGFGDEPTCGPFQGLL